MTTEKNKCSTGSWGGADANTDRGKQPVSGKEELINIKKFESQPRSKISLPKFILMA